MSKRAGSPVQNDSLPPVKLKENFFMIFNNSIEKHEDTYYCHLCRTDVQSIISDHVKSTQHENAIARRKKDHSIHRERTPSRELCEIFIKNGILRVAPRLLKCYTCDTLLIKYKDAKKHIREARHKAKRQLPFRFPDLPKNDGLKGPQKYADFIRYGYKVDDEKILTCYICAIKELWKNHKEDREHFYKMRFFDDHFVDCPGEEVICKRCDGYTFIPKGALIDHAADVHRLAPWFRPPDEYVTFFKNLIVPMGLKFYCFLCDKVINSRWFGALAHTKSYKHSILVTVKEEDINQEVLNHQYCEKLSTNMIFPLNKTQLKCWVCDHIIDGYENYDQHIIDETHIAKLKEKKDELMERKNEIQILKARLEKGSASGNEQKTNDQGEGEVENDDHHEESAEN